MRQETKQVPFSVGAPAQGRRATGPDRARHLMLDASDVANMGLAKAGPVAAEHVRRFQRRE